MHYTPEKIFEQQRLTALESLANQIAALEAELTEKQRRLDKLRADYVRWDEATYADVA